MRIFAILLCAGIALALLRDFAVLAVTTTNPASIDRTEVAADPVPAVAVVVPEEAPTRELVVSGDTVSLREAELEREVASLRAQLADLTFARAAAVDVTLAHVLQALEDSHLTRTQELRAFFVAQVRPADALRLLEAEDRLRDRLAKTRSSMLGTPALTYEWPVKRDQLVHTFFRELADAGLSEKAIELYRVAIADYL